jgi:hypothetical protein
MYTRELLLVAGILLLVLLSQREHLTFTGPIKDIRNTVDQAEQDRIFAMAPQSLQSRATAANAALGAPGPDRSKTILAGIIKDFQTEVYVPATAPITDAVVDTFVAAKRTYYRSTPTAFAAAFYDDAYSNGDARRLLRTYFNLEAPVLSADRLPTTSGTTASIPQVLEQMRDMLLEYKMSGDTRYKSAYDGLKSWMDRYVAELNLQLTREADTVTTEVSSYQTANADLTKTQSDFRTAVKEGPEVENAYLTIKQQMNQGGPSTESSSSTYIKGGIAVGLIVGAIVLTFV